MAIDPNISLQAKGPDLLGQAGQVLGVVQSAQNLQQSRFQFTQKQLQQVQNDFNAIAQDPLISMAANDPDPQKRAEYGKQIVDKLQVHADFAKQAGVPDTIVNRALAPYISIATLHPEQLQQLIAQRQQALVGAAGQMAQTQVPVGAQQTAAGTNISGMPISAFRTQFGQMGLAPTPTRGVGQTAPALGQPQAIGGVLEPVTRDWSETQQNAISASRNIGVLQNIKHYAKGAITGVTNERRSFIAGLAGLLGISTQELEKTNTDLLIKNSNMMTLTGWNTDAARALAEGANPNTTMTHEAIQKAADQIIAQQQLALKKQNFMKNYASQMTRPNDLGRSYNEALTKWNEIADPRILQFKNMSSQDRAEFKNSLSPNEQTDFVNKLRKAEKLGIFK